VSVSQSSVSTGDTVTPSSDIAAFEQPAMFAAFGLPASL
jgi:hypothetical protein